MSRRTRALGLVVAGPLALSALALAVAWSVRGDLPDPVATHWGTGGPDGFTGRDRALLLTLLGAPIGILTGGLVVLLTGKAPGFRRFGGGLALGLAGFVDTVGLGSLWVQRGLADARQAPAIEPVLIVALVVALAVGLLGARLTPGEDPEAAVAHDPVPADAPRLHLGEGRSGTWSRWTVSGLWLPVVVALTLGPLLVLAVLDVVPWFVLVLGVITVALVGSTAACRVTVGPGGLTVVGPLGVPRFRVPLEQVAEAGASQVDPFRDFGGWGVRAAAGGRYGVVLRRGPALTVRRGDGTTFVVTVDDADEAAALLNTLADRVPRPSA